MCANQYQGLRNHDQGLASEEHVSTNSTGGVELVQHADSLSPGTADNLAAAKELGGSQLAMAPSSGFTARAAGGDDGGSVSPRVEESMATKVCVCTPQSYLGTCGRRSLG